MRAKHPMPTSGEQRPGRLGVAAVTYVGYPVWALSVGRRLRELADAPTAERLPVPASR